MSVEVLAADHQNKPELGAAVARQWFDQSGVDAIVNVGNSALALAVNSICREKNKVLLATAAGTAELTGKQCSPNTVHWTWDTWSAAKAAAVSALKTGGQTWFLIAPDYALGHQLARDTTRFVSEGSGRILGNTFYPFPETTDFSSYLNQARASRAQVLGLCNSGADSVNSVKQAHEFNVHQDMQVIAMVGSLTTVHALGLETAERLLVTESFYWDLSDPTRAFMERIRRETPRNWPNSAHAGDYAATLHYFKAAAGIGVVSAKADGRAVVARMKAMPTDDDCFGHGYIREDGRKIHPSYLFQVKSPAESNQQWDLYKQIATTPADDAIRPLE